MEIEIIEETNHLKNRTYYMVRINGYTHSVDNTLEEAMVVVDKIKNLKELTTRKTILSETISDEQCPA